MTAIEQKRPFTATLDALRTALNTPGDAPTQPGTGGFGATDVVERVFGQRPELSGRDPGRNAPALGGVPVKAYFVQAGGANAASVAKASNVRLQPGTPLPDPTSTPTYDGLPAGDGKLHRGHGNSGWVGRWAGEFGREFRGVESQRKQLDADKAAFDKTMTSEAADIDKAKGSDKAFGQQLHALNKKTGGEAFRLVKEYRSDKAKARLAREHGLPKAYKKADAAKARYDKAVSADKQNDLEAQKSNQAARRASIEKRIAERDEVVGMLVDGATGFASNPTGAGTAINLGGKLAKQLLGGMTDAEMKELIGIDARIAVLDDQIAKETNVQKKAELVAARADLQASFDDIVLAHAKVQHHEKAAWGKLDQLQALEKEHGTGTFFRQVHDYQTKVATAGQDLFDDAGAYERKLNTRPFNEAEGLYDAVAADRKHVDVYDLDDSGEFDWRAKALGAYLGQFERWREGELDNTAKTREDLRSSKHLTPVDDAMADANRALGGTDDKYRYNR